MPSSHTSRGHQPSAPRPGWLPSMANPPERSGRPWRPPSLKGIRVDFRKVWYVLVEEMVGDSIGLRVSPWPGTDEAALPVFADPEEDLEIGAALTDLQGRLDRLRRAPRGPERQAARELRYRPVSLGDVFAAHVDRRHLLVAASSDEVSDVRWLRAPVYDVTGDARESARRVFYAAVTAPLSRAAHSELVAEQLASETTES